MSSEPMELAKNWDPAKANKVLPAYAQIKYDGVPLTFTRPADNGPVVALTRQNEQALSVPHLLEVAELLLNTPGASFTAECFVPGLSFKNSSGIIRRQTPDADTALIRGVIFDANPMNRPKDAYMTRFKQMEVLITPLNGTGFQIAPYKLVSTVEEVEIMWETLQQLTKLAGGAELEGMMMHSLTKPFAPGKRCWGMSRYKPQPTIDLQVIRYVEAVSEAGDPLGMLGRVEVALRRRIDGNVVSSEVGIGPGKLSHDERKAIWQAATPVLASGLGPRTPATKTFAEIKYMPDPSYDALRQPTVQRLRTDKEEGDILEY